LPELGASLRESFRVSSADNRIVASPNFCRATTRHFPISRPKANATVPMLQVEPPVAHEQAVAVPPSNYHRASVTLRVTRDQRPPSHKTQAPGLFHGQIIFPIQKEREDGEHPLAAVGIERVVELEIVDELLQYRSVRECFT